MDVGIVDAGKAKFRRPLAPGYCDINTPTFEKRQSE
jgi:hypothetical protein